MFSGEIARPGKTRFSSNKKRFDLTKNRNRYLTFTLNMIKIMSKKKKKKHSSFHAAQVLQRNRAIQDGFYDGRFMTKVVKDRKKEESKRKARGKVDLRKEE
jgi:hypothetical protein